MLMLQITEDSNYKFSLKYNDNYIKSFINIYLVNNSGFKKKIYDCDFMLIEKSDIPYFVNLK